MVLSERHELNVWPSPLTSKQLDVALYQGALILRVGFWVYSKAHIIREGRKLEECFLLGRMPLSVFAVDAIVSFVALNFKSF